MVLYMVGTALPLHYESQCLPTPVAPLMYFLPGWWHKLCVVATFVIEIAIPFMFFSPVRAHRIFSCYSQVSLVFNCLLSFIKV